MNFFEQHKLYVKPESVLVIDTSLMQEQVNKFMIPIQYVSVEQTLKVCCTIQLSLKNC